MNKQDKIAVLKAEIAQYKIEIENSAKAAEANKGLPFIAQCHRNGGEWLKSKLTAAENELKTLEAKDEE